MPKPARKSAKPTAAKEQAKRFIEAAREAECSEDEAVFDENLKRIDVTPVFHPVETRVRG
jgi:hypothetical protein